MKIKRPVRIEGDVAIIPLTLGKEAVIDASDVPLIDKWNWRAVPRKHTVYAGRGVMLPDGKKTQALLHRQIIQAPEGVQVDHIDGDGLNNRRSNLRLCTHHENQCNSRLRADSSSGLKGVDWRPDRMKWRARISVKNRRIDLGYFDTPEAAHQAYKAASAKFHGAFGRTE